MIYETEVDQIFEELEKKTPEIIPNTDYIVIRIDGCHFHSLTRVFYPVYDAYFQYVLNKAYQHLLHKIGNFYWSIAYSFSDEFSIILYPLPQDDIIHTRVFGGRKTKFLSVFPSLVASAFKTELYNCKTDDAYFPMEVYDLFYSLSEEIYPKTKTHGSKISLIADRLLSTDIYFDCKIFSTSDKALVEKYIYNRYRYATKSCINSIAHLFYSPKKLESISTEEREKLLKNNYNIDIKKLPNIIKHGTIYKTNHNSIEFDYVDEKDTLSSKYIHNIQVIHLNPITNKDGKV